MNKTLADEYIECMHDGCHRRAKYIVSHEDPNHRQFKGQTHNCCAIHAPRQTNQRHQGETQ